MTTRTTRANNTGDQALVRAVLSGDQKAAEQFLRTVADTVWTACHLLTRLEADARDAFMIVNTALQRDGFQRLRAYDGRSRLHTFVALITRDVLAQRLLRLLHEDSSRGWAAFEQFFAADIRRLILRRLPGQSHEDARADAYQEACVALIDNDYHRLKAYSGAGSFTGFVLHMVDRLVIDFIRSFSSRRRAPASITRLPALEQEIFKLVYWEGVTPRTEALGPPLARRLAARPAADEIAAALDLVRRHTPPGYGSSTGAAARMVSLSETPEIADRVSVDGPVVRSPEDIALEREQESLLGFAAKVLREVAETLPETERLYLRIALGGPDALPAREVARLMQRPVEEIHKLRPRVLKSLKEALENRGEVKTWRASV
jgi:RNA polymerase primary sigma factor